MRGDAQTSAAVFLRLSMDEPGGGNEQKGSNRPSGSDVSPGPSQGTASVRGSNSQQMRILEICRVGPAVLPKTSYVLIRFPLFGLVRRQSCLAFASPLSSSRNHFRSQTARTARTLSQWCQAGRSSHYSETKPFKILPEYGDYPYRELQERPALFLSRIPSDEEAALPNPWSGQAYPAHR